MTWDGEKIPIPRLVSHGLATVYVALTSSGTLTVVQSGTVPEFFGTEWHRSAG